MFLREYRKKVRDYYMAQYATPRGIDRVWITMIIVTIILEVVILGPLIASLE